jgi:inner membrane protein
MEGLFGFLEHLTVWHWLGVGIVLLTLEVAIGTFDLLWIAMGAFLTALFALLVPDPAGAQLVFFGVVAVVFVAMGRTLFRGLRRRSTTHPNLNDRMTTLIGQRGEAAGAFENGHGRVKIGDTVWQAKADGEIAAGAAIVVDRAEGTLLQVKLG